MPPHRKILTRFWEKIDRSGECWLWTGKTMAWGYGRFYPHPGQYV